MNDISPALREEVVERAGNRCEYCRLSQIGQEATFHIDHIIPRAAGGPTSSDNLALACVSCSLRKGAKQSAVDPESGLEVALFHPRRQLWNDHFQWHGVNIAPLTAVGRATEAALGMNRPVVLDIRQEEIERGRHPPA
jgi:hypothetical protein